jgi:hypothetical protein
MKKLTIGYMPLSENLNHPADRRRIVFYAKVMGHKIETDLTRKVDLLVISERANLVPFIRTNRHLPTVFDLIDGYLTPSSFPIDVLRGISKSLVGQLSFNYFSFKKLVQKMCLSVDAVVCSTPEQSALASNYNLNVHTILDSHSEIPFQDIKRFAGKNPFVPKLLWEGLPYTIDGLNQIKTKKEFYFNFVTDLTYNTILGTYWKNNTVKYIERKLKLSVENYSISQWSIDSLIQNAKNSNIAVLPLNIKKSMNLYKAENRLLIMWRLGLPVLVSPALSYKRIMNEINTIGICNSSSDFNNIISDLFYREEELLNQVNEGRNYINKYHTDEMLIDKWNKVIESIL